MKTTVEVLDWLEISFQAALMSKSKKSLFHWISLEILKSNLAIENLLETRRVSMSEGVKGGMATGSQAWSKGKKIPELVHKSNLLERATTAVEAEVEA